MTAEIRPNDGSAPLRDDGRCEDVDEVVGEGSLHVEQMDDATYWARLDLLDGRAIVMWFTAVDGDGNPSKIRLIAEWD